MADTVMYASDYPHWDSDYPASFRHIQRRPDLSDAPRVTLLGRTTQRFYGLA